MLRFELKCCARYLSLRILNILGFIQDNYLETSLPVKVDIETQKSVTGYEKIRLGALFESLCAFGPFNRNRFQLRRELCGLFQSVLNQR